MRGTLTAGGVGGSVEQRMVVALNKGIVFAIEALVSLLASVAFLSYVNVGSQEVSYREVYAYQSLQDVLEVSVKSESIYQKILDWRRGDALAEDWLRNKFTEISEALGSRCLRMHAGGKSIAVECGASNAKAPRKQLKFRGERIFFDGKDFFAFEVELEI